MVLLTHPEHANQSGWSMFRGSNWIHFFHLLNVWVSFQSMITIFWLTYLISNRRVTRRGEGKGWGLPCLFRKLEKRALILGKYTLIGVIYRLNFSFTVKFLRVSRRKNKDFALRDLSFSWCRWLFTEVP